MRPLVPVVGFGRRFWGVVDAGPGVGAESFCRSVDLDRIDASGVVEGDLDRGAGGQIGVDPAGACSLAWTPM
ncbi:hypothetical protein [Streptomyces sioyaensis]|uniref:hypothetical protein n=1 Tax=Streptomyces sioyaensis TaxID=67364 RepID=UPI00378EC1F4